jgi:hypothetical protein
MNDALTRSDAAREMARARWGTSRLDRMIAEITDRADELGPEQVRSLARVTARAAAHTHEGEDR